MKHPLTAGIDVGAVSTKAAILRGNRIIAYAIVPTGINGSAAATTCLRAALSWARHHARSLGAVGATGYGRAHVHGADIAATEITCHARGASLLFPGTETVIDIGGQDSKIIFLDNGVVRDFVMNDRCAAGTGRFLEVMARALAVPLERMGAESLLRHRRRRVVISHTCTVFAESEVISLLAAGVRVCDILFALHEAIAERVLSMAHSARLGGRIVLSGGVAKNEGVRDALRRLGGRQLRVPEEPQITGAIGAALIAQDSFRRPRSRPRPPFTDFGQKKRPALYKGRPSLASPSIRGSAR